jgi:hypothetical protein
VWRAGAKVLAVHSFVYFAVNLALLERRWMTGLSLS